MKLLATLLSSAIALVLLEPVSAQIANAPPRPPKLLVLISIDQMRGDYIDKFQHQWSK